MANEWTSVISSFNATVQIFRNLINNAIRYKPLVDAVYIGFDLNVTNEIFSGAFYENLDMTTLAAKQNQAIQFLKESSFDYAGIAAAFNARLIMYTSVNKDYATNDSVAQMLKIIRRALTVGHTATQVGHTCKRRERR